MINVPKIKLSACRYTACVLLLIAGGTTLVGCYPGHESHTPEQHDETMRRMTPTGYPPYDELHNDEYYEDRR